MLLREHCAADVTNSSLADTSQSNRFAISLFVSIYNSYRFLILGEGLLRSLLDRPIFLKTINGSFLQVDYLLGIRVTCFFFHFFFQLCGIPSAELINTFGAEEFINGSRSRKSQNKSSVIRGSTVLPRYKLFYNIRRFEVTGLPPNHCLFKVPTVCLFAVSGLIFFPFFLLCRNL
jgi:hypothetical protein